MKKKKSDLDFELQKVILKLGKKEKRACADMIIKEKNFPEIYAYDIFSGKTAPGELTEFEDYCVLTVCVKNHVAAESLISDYYTKIEISNYDNIVFQRDDLEFPEKPLVFKMIQVEDDHWVGSYTVQELMKLRSASLLDYNENTQRVMSYKVHGGEGMYQISINYKAVNQIKDAMEKGIFIPNTITLNINEDKNPDFYYSNGELIVKAIDGFDILDGFHRYLAMGQIYDVNKSWDYKMELRIVSFSESKAKQFIFQEDQKTPMSKAASNSMNQHSWINKLVKRLNDDSDCNLSGQIKQNGNVNSIVFTEALSNTKIVDVKDMMTNCKNLKAYINEVTEYDMDLIDTRWSNRQIMILVYGYKYGVDAIKTAKAVRKANDMVFSTQLNFYTLTSTNRKWIEEAYANV